MGDKDPPPFGYTFSDDFFAGPSPTLDAEAPPQGHGQSLLNDLENQSLADFFSNTDPFHLAEPDAFPAPLDSKDAVWDYNNWSDFIAPATVHRVTTTIPDHAHLHHSYYHEPAFTSSLQADHLGNTHDDLQAASTLFNTTQPSYAPSRAHSYHGPPVPLLDTNASSASASSHNGRPMVITPHGPINEQLAALLPKHNENGTLDAQLAAHWAANKASEQIQQHEAEHNPGFKKPNFKRSYTFGTDNSFNSPAGFSRPHDPSHYDDPRFLVRSIVGLPEPATSMSIPPIRSHDKSEDEKSEDGTSADESSDKPPRKRRKGKSRVDQESPRKTARNGKNRKTSLLEENSKKKRVSAAAQKLQRENLTEEQKRSNHILSEQKRRNLIKRGFDDLHDLVPEIRNGGLSKSSVLTEAGNFLEKLIQDNNAFWHLSGGAPSASSG
ncbi:hypothetical protein T440DRAFT_185393 [Plenodomus tracheiphilus IPT5]|uniref:BHLH domain-containing protein n=1 Tax=Plenodomus tracheiphilus IPT5 TaxID=1408161 RepID=A0A6A7AZV7_9PLEO|nr:hypothetical protein T440DRAFT_185393 [Plenodomus tracheiphilus IPT5]